MKLYLVRHGEATDRAPRPLSVRGREEVARIAAFLARSAARVDVVEHSGKARAQETAEILSRAIGDGSATTRPGLAPDDSVTSFASELEGRHEELLVVSHLPFVDRALGALLGTARDEVTGAFEPGTVACLERAGRGGWALRFFLPPSLLSG